MRFQHPSQMSQCHVDTPLGPVLLARTPQGLAGLWFEGQQHSPDTTGWHTTAQDPLLQDAAHQLNAYLKGQRLDFALPLDLSHGTAFQQSVWQALRRIERGHTLRYGELAQAIGLPSASRAVGAAVGRNPLSVIVPCHRVLGAHGRLTGYAGGLARKVQLLQLEGVAATLPASELTMAAAAHPISHARPTQARRPMSA